MSGGASLAEQAAILEFDRRLIDTRDFETLFGLFVEDCLVRYGADCRALDVRSSNERAVVSPRASAARAHGDEGRRGCLTRLATG